MEVLVDHVFENAVFAHDGAYVEPLLPAVHAVFDRRGKRVIDERVGVPFPERSHDLLEKLRQAVTQRGSDDTFRWNVARLDFAKEALDELVAMLGDALEKTRFGHALPEPFANSVPCRSFVETRLAVTPAETFRHARGGVARS